MTASSSSQQPPVPSIPRRILSAQLGPVLGTAVAVVGVVLMAMISWETFRGVNGISVGAAIGTAVGGYVGWLRRGVSGATGGLLGGLAGGGIGCYFAIACGEQWSGIEWAVLGGGWGLLWGLITGVIIGGAASGWASLRVRAENPKFVSSILARTSLLLWAASLALPMDYGAELFGLIRGWTYLLLAFVLPFSLEIWEQNPFLRIVLLALSGLSYISTPLSRLAAIISYRLAAVLAVVGLIAPVLCVLNQGLYIHRFLRNDYVLNSGGLCSLGAAVVMLTAWTVAIWRKRAARPEVSQSQHRPNLPAEGH